ncbi:MAG: type IX secretion system membrane protein PorP/SprF [Ferruginibacter sp.]
MKKITLVLIAVTGLLQLKAQQKPYYTQYILNNYILNPALSGIENYTDVKISYRNQWTGIDGAPVSTYLSIQGPVNKKDYRTNATSFEVPGENPRGKQYWEQYTAPEPHHGIGMMIMNDKTGYLNRYSVYATYAYHKPLGIKTTLSMGFLGGISGVNLDRSKIVWGNLDPNDPAIGYNDGELKKIRPEVGAGLWLYSRDYFLGASVLNIIPGKAKFVNNDIYGGVFVPHIFLNGGYRFQLNEDVSLLPSATVQWINPEPVQIAGNAKLQYQDKAWIGASYRFTDELGGFAAMAGINIPNAFNISYAYDVATNSRLRTYTRNTHEIMIGFLLGNKYSDSCPRNNW